MNKMVLTAKTKFPWMFLVLLIMGCTPTKKPVEFEFEKSYINYGYYQGFNYSGINIIRDEKTYNHSFGDFKDFANSVEVIMVNDLDNDNEIDIFLKLSACGANCSGQHQILFYDPTGDKYVSTEPLAREKIEPINYRHGDSITKIYVTRDDDFISIFSKPVTGIGPIQILKYQDRRFQDITKEYPQIIEEDAKYWEARIRNVDIDMSEEYTKITGIQNYKQREIYDLENESRLHVLYLLSYISDMCSIGKCEDGWETFRNYCSEEESFDLEACNRFEENIKLAFETRKVLK